MRKKVGLFTLGIILILCGTFILLNRYTDIQLLSDIYLLWPAFLILLGLEFIFSKLWYDSRKQDIQLSPSGMSIFLAVIILLFSSLWMNQGISLPNWDLNLQGAWPQMYSDSVDESIIMEDISLTNVEKIMIRNVRGSVEVHPSDDNQLRLEAAIRFQTNDATEAKNLINNVVTINEGTTLEVISRNPANQQTHSLQFVNLKLWIPKEMEIQVTTEFGRVWVKDRNNHVTIKQQHGDIEADRIVGNLVIDTSFGESKVANIDGDVLIRSAHGQVEAGQVSGAAEIHNSFADTSARQISKDLSIQSKHGQVNAENISGNVFIENEFDTIDCDTIKGNLKVAAKHSKVNLKNIQGDIDGETAYETLQLSNPSYGNADIKITTTYGTIRNDENMGLNINKENNLQEASIVNGNGEQTIRLKNQHGDIRIDID